MYLWVIRQRLGHHNGNLVVLVNQWSTINLHFILRVLRVADAPHYQVHCSVISQK